MARALACPLSPSGLTRYYPKFPWAIPLHKASSYVLLTRPPLAAISIATNALPSDLHVLSMPPAFNLSQDQTLQFKTVLSPSTYFLSALHLSILLRSLAITLSSITTIESLKLLVFLFGLKISLAPLFAEVRTIHYTMLILTVNTFLRSLS